MCVRIRVRIELRLDLDLGLALGSESGSDLGKGLWYTQAHSILRRTVRSGLGSDMAWNPGSQLLVALNNVLITADSFIKKRPPTGNVNAADRDQGGGS